MSAGDADVNRPAANPDADIACDFEVAVSLQEEGIRERLSRGALGPARKIEDGIELRLRSDAWDAVLRYIEVESQCCPFLDLAARRDANVVVLTVRGRPEAQPVIEEIFSTGTNAAG